MIEEHPIKDFIRRKLSESVQNGDISEFTSNTVWNSIVLCRKHYSADLLTNFNLDTCLGCGDRKFPCRRLKLTASYWDDDQEFKEKWGTL